eukprot:9886740-Prorocentrum_lima.AAC.1
MIRYSQPGSRVAVFRTRTSRFKRPAMTFMLCPFISPQVKFLGFQQFCVFAVLLSAYFAREFGSG